MYSNRENPAVVLTGASGFLGWSIAKSLVESGWMVIAVDKNPTPLSLPNLEFIEADLSNTDAYHDVAKRVIALKCNLKALINNAAYNPQTSGDTQEFTPFESYQIPKWEEEIRINLTAPIFLTQALLSGFNHSDSKPCKIVNVTSMYGITPPNQSIYESLGAGVVKPIGYPVTKAALDMATRYLACYLATRNFNVNAIAPGGIANGESEKFKHAYSQLSPIGRMGDVSELIEAFKFLLGDGSNYMCGHTLVVDGGWTVW
jgi:NAD(P)-dependent dehydrogenase (short-subunit alcohol dehydrogenase family)